MRDEHWLLAYEGPVRGWLNYGPVDHIATCPCFSHMRTTKVRFYTKFRQARRVAGIIEEDELPTKYWNWADDDGDDFDEY